MSHEDLFMPGPSMAHPEQVVEHQNPVIPVELQGFQLE